MVVLLVPIMMFHGQRRYVAARTLTFVATAALTLALIGSLALLIEGILHHKDNPASLLRSAAVLWIINVLVFALWY
jgi:hypothetical protein